MSAPQGFEDIQGTVAITNSQGPIYSGLTGIGLGQSPNFFASGMADPSGNYDLLVPSGNPAIDTSAQFIHAFDPVTGALLATEPLDLSGATPGLTITVPKLSGSCNDADASTPDADDPDCD